MMFVAHAGRRLLGAGRGAAARRALLRGVGRRKTAAALCQSHAPADGHASRGRGCTAAHAAGNGGSPGSDSGPGTPEAYRVSFAVWTQLKKDVPSLLSSWAAESASGPEEEEECSQATAYLRALSTTECPKGWLVWAIADVKQVPSGMGGFFLVPPCQPQALVFLEAIDAQVNNVQHIAINPTELGPGVRTAVQDWMETLKPKKNVIRHPEELKFFGLEISGGRGAAGGAKVSKGL